MAVEATRRMVILLVTALVVVAMMSVAVVAATPAFAQGGSENSCGASNPNIGEFPPNRFNKDEQTGSGEFEDCGFRNNPNGTPPGQPG